MLRTILRVLSAGLAAQGAFMVWIARYGTLWAYETDLGWFAPYVLRPGMYAIGSFTVVFGVWYAWLAYTTGGRVLATWADDVRHDLAAGAVADLGWPTVLRSYSRELWDRRGCVIGRHAMEALNYFPDEGTVCEDCGLVVALRLGWRDRLWLLMNREDKVQARWSAHLDRLVPPLEAGLAKLSASGPALNDDAAWAEYDRSQSPTPADLLRAQAGRCAEAGLHDTAAELRAEAEKLDAEERRENRCFACYRPISEHEVGEYDDECPHFVPQMDDGCFTQGSDAVLRRTSCDKEG